MHVVREVTDGLYWIGANDHRLTLFENIHPIPEGVSYNSYVSLGEKRFCSIRSTGMPAGRCSKISNMCWTGAISIILS